MGLESQNEQHTLAKYMSCGFKLGEFARDGYDLLRLQQIVDLYSFGTTKDYIIRAVEADISSASFEPKKCLSALQTLYPVEQFPEKWV